MIFFSNPKITSARLIEPHYQQTAERIKRSDANYVLALQDQMRLNYKPPSQDRAWAHWKVW